MNPGDLAAVGRLVSFALQPRLLPGREPDYAALIARYKNEPAFADALNSVCEGQGLRILGCDRLGGLVVVPSTPDTPFRFRLSDYMSSPTVQQRLLHGLAHLAIAATCYPSAAALEDEAAPLPSVTVHEVQERVERLASALQQRYGQADPPVDQPELEPVWRLVLRTRATDTTADGRSTPHTTLGMIKKALTFLEEQGLADKLSRPNEEDVYRMRARYRLHVLDAARQALTVARDCLGSATPTIDSVVREEG